ncbi:MAG: polysulfide reductase NrfD [Candidatus Hydrogenedentes bacterium]|nr:polysulfide reductase NrfD [Candidatus Hydrogenedentota bacterium]
MAVVQNRLTDIDPQPPLLEPGHDYGTLTDKVGDIVDRKPHPRAWIVTMAVASLLLLLFLNAVGYLFVKGTGIWGINVPVAWGWAIINFVWWIGIGHAGTLISAILLLLMQDWRTSINRFAEAMTLFAVACAGMFPLLHMGRPWLFYFILPYPNTMALWPQFRSPLVWDVFAISTYATVSALFWYTGLVPDLATMRDRAKNKLAKIAFGMASLGWRGSARHWSRYEMAYLLLAGISTPLVVSVHSVVSFDFAVGIIPGWHTTIFPPYFVAGAVYAGFAMVLTLAIPIRKLYHIEDIITMKHIDNMAKVMLVTGLVVSYGYFTEAFFAWYSGNIYEKYMMFSNRMSGYYAWSYWALIFCNGFVPQFLWFKRIRSNVYALFAISIVVSIGMWLERYVIVVTSLARDFLPSSWGNYHGTIWDWATYLGTIGLFLFLFMLFIRFVPMVAIFELKALLYSQKHNGKAH